MLVPEEQRALIERIVKSNRNYTGNEDLLEDFCSEAYQKSYMVFNSSSNIEKIESYVAKVVHASIINVLKDSGRVRRNSTGYVATNEIKIADLKPAQMPGKKVIAPEFVLDFPDPKESAEEVLITKDCLRRIVDSVCIIHKELPKQMFFDLFCLRYVKNMKQSEIARSLNLSQAEVSKRLLKLSKLISNYLDNGNKQD